MYKTATLKEMTNWNYKKAWSFFCENAYNRLIPETEIYIRSLPKVETEDIRGDINAKDRILKSIDKKTLILIDGASLNGKTTLANRLAKNIGATTVIDIDLICKDWLDEQLAKTKSTAEAFQLLLQMNEMTDIYILENLEKIVKKHSQKGNVILVGCYMEVIYRAIITRTLGKYFEQTISIYCCAKKFKDVVKMKKLRDKEFGCSGTTLESIEEQYKYSKRLTDGGGFMLGFGMAYSYIVDNTVSNMFV